MEPDIEVGYRSRGEKRTAERGLKSNVPLFFMMVPCSNTFVEMSPGIPFPPVGGGKRERDRERDKIEEEVVGLNCVRTRDVSTDRERVDEGPGSA